MRASLLFFLILISYAVIGQGKFFIGSNGDYSILTNQNVATKSTKNPAGGYVDYYILRENNVFVFMLSVTRVKLSATDPNLIYSDEYKKNYLKECGCEMLDYKRTAFNNFSGVIFKIKSDLDGKIVNGYSVSTVSSGVLFNINFLAQESKFSTLTPEFEKAINSLVFNDH